MLDQGPWGVGWAGRGTTVVKPRQACGGYDAGGGGLAMPVGDTCASHSETPQEFTQATPWHVRGMKCT